MQGGGKKPFISSALFIRCYVADTWKVSQSLTGMLTQNILQSFSSSAIENREI